MRPLTPRVRATYAGRKISHVRTCYRGCRMCDQQSLQGCRATVKHGIVRRRAHSFVRSLGHSIAICFGQEMQ